VSGPVVAAAVSAAGAAAVLVGPPRRLSRLRVGDERGRPGRTAARSAPATPRRPGTPGSGAEVGDDPDRVPGSRSVRRRIALGCLVVAVGLLAGSVPVACGLAVAAGVADRLLDRLEPASDRARTDQVVASLPGFADVVAAAVRAGIPPVSALRTCAAAFGGPIGVEVGRVVARLDLGVPADRAWTDALAVEGLAPLARAMARGTRRGTSPVAVLERCSVDARRVARAAARRRAQAVGVTAAAPLGLCFLPAFVLVAVVPMVVGGLAGFLR